MLISNKDTDDDDGEEIVTYDRELIFFCWSGLNSVQGNATTCSDVPDSASYFYGNSVMYPPFLTCSD